MNKILNREKKEELEMKWEKGVVYKISPKTKKSVVYIQIYEKDGLEIKYAEAYRSGWVTVLGDEMLGGYGSLVVLTKFGFLCFHRAIFRLQNW